MRLRWPPAQLQRVEPLSGHVIGCLVGENGSGKTLLGIEYQIRRALLRERRVLSNVAVWDVWPEGTGPGCLKSVDDLLALGGVFPKGFIYWDRVEQLLDFSNGLVFCDEVHTTFPSRAWQGLPLQVGARVDSFRHYRVDFWWTAPAFHRADSVLRDVTQNVVLCKRVGREPVEWKPARRVKFRRFGVGALNSQGRPNNRGVKAGPFTWHTQRVSRTWAAAHYDSEAPVGLIDLQAVVAGVCVNCGGVRARPKCSCEVGSNGKRPVVPGGHYA